MVSHIACDPDPQITAIAQAFIILSPVRHTVSFLRKLVVAIGIEFMRYEAYP